MCCTYPKTGPAYPVTSWRKPSPGRFAHLRLGGSYAPARRNRYNRWGCHHAQPDSPEAALSQSEECFRAFVTSTPDAVYRMIADWRKMHQLMGKSFLPDTSTANASWLEQYIPSADRAQVQAAIDAAISDKKPFELAHRIIRADGSLGWTFSRAIPLLDE